MSPRRVDARSRYYLGFALLAALQFYVRPRVWDDRTAPDFLFLALMLIAVRARPGVAAAAGFLIGIVNDVLTPASFGAGALAHTVVGYLTALGRSVFFPDNLLVNAALFGGGVWVRDALVLLASRTPSGELTTGLLVWSPLQALSTAVAGGLLLLAFRDWFAIRLET
jgi:rod shape-determining protein MreD